MKKVFPLETLLKVRDQRVKTLQVELAEIEREMKNLSFQERELERDIEEMNKNLHEKRVQGDLKNQWVFFQFQTHLFERKNHLLKEVDKRIEEISLKQQDLNRAIQERKIVEKLKEKHYSRYQSAHYSR